MAMSINEFGDLLSRLNASVHWSSWAFVGVLGLVNMSLARYLGHLIGSLILALKKLKED